ncbi:centaurin-gamma-1A [Galendromus occidentalis]|uniref:Centaurin-gamma-1A n=1 Tax=Galendromus occidentalis TaxID=34638 RepID=A0AAJ7WJF7_9ACAR|nr:centaurin-gamma-1A [Galendromus occidentalis]
MSSQRSSPFLSSSLSIRQEIDRFESVHPSIYAIYDLIEALNDQFISQQVREHVVCIEDAFVNSPEWTLSRNVPDIRLGVLGSLSSGKSSLVHRYLTGSYIQEESPEGGRFKKEISVDGSSYLMMIRDEAGAPEWQFAQWVDAVLLVFSLENEVSFQEILSFYKKMRNFRMDVPVILIGTQDAISENNPRKITDQRARKLAQELGNCAYYETCATYGLNVEKVFSEVCHRLVAESSYRNSTLTSSSSTAALPTDQPTSFFSATTAERSTLSSDRKLSDPQPLRNGSDTTIKTEASIIPLSLSPGPKTDSKLSLVTDKTPVGTPNAARKNKRRSNLFSKDKEKDKVTKANGQEYGVGRSIPVKQGYLLKRSLKGLAKESKKKKYVTLTKDGRLTYHATIHDYMNNHNGKEIELMQTTVKIPGQNPRGCQNRVIPNTNPMLSTKETPLNKKRSHHKRMKSGGSSKMLDDTSLTSEELDFMLISVSCKTWRFEAATTQERDEWVTAIEELILNSLQACESAKGGADDDVQGQAINALKYQVAGNKHCVDCDAPNPDWASVNHGALMCITCSGIHRNLGSHISRVRSLNLDDWSAEQLSVMAAIGNTMANTIWESNTKEEGKPTPNSSREEKERWIRAKYLDKEFLKNLPRSVPQRTPLTYLVDGIESGDVARVLLALAHGANVDVSVVEGRTPVHLAVARGNTAIVQLMLMASGRESSCKDGVLKEVQERKV